MCTIPQDCWASGQLAYWRPRWSSTVLSTLVGVTVTANNTYPLLVIVTCSNGQLAASVSEVFAISSEGLQVQLTAQTSFSCFPTALAQFIRKESTKLPFIAAIRRLQRLLR